MVVVGFRRTFCVLIDLVVLLYPIAKIDLFELESQGRN